MSQELWSHWLIYLTVLHMIGQSNLSLPDMKQREILLDAIESPNTKC